MIGKLYSYDGAILVRQWDSAELSTIMNDYNSVSNFLLNMQTKCQQ
jgi:hypothetical protein